MEFINKMKNVKVAEKMNQAGKKVNDLIHWKQRKKEQEQAEIKAINQEVRKLQKELVKVEKKLWEVIYENPLGNLSLDYRIKVAVTSHLMYDNDNDINKLIRKLKEAIFSYTFMEESLREELKKA